jgi:hypothetical protein
MDRPMFSLIVPTRGRPGPLRRFLDSVAATARCPDQIEVILVTDEDDPASLGVRHPQLTLREVVGPPGRTMGALNAAGARAARGAYLMLLNDDVVVRTRGWDETTHASFRRFPDPFALVHVNDTLMCDHLCTFPIVSREFCDLAGDICPEVYNRYRIDDHVEDVFNLLGALGERRVVYLPDVVFEHTNAVEHPEAGRVYQSDPALLAQDAPHFDALLPARKELALLLLERIKATPATAAQRETLAKIADSFALRTPGRQIVVRRPWWRRTGQLAGGAAELWRRARDYARRKGYRGLVRRLLSGRPARDCATATRSS